MMRIIVCAISCSYLKLLNRACHIWEQVNKADSMASRIFLVSSLCIIAFSWQSKLPMVEPWQPWRCFRFFSRNCKQPPAESNGKAIVREMTEDFFKAELCFDLTCKAILTEIIGKYWNNLGKLCEQGKSF